MWLSLKRCGNELEVVVKDDGIGFDVARISDPQTTKGFGLFSIREQLNNIGGRLNLESKPGHGARVTITAPLIKSK
jgi:signal transduction histidine kinase